LSPQRQTQLRQLDHDLHDEESAISGRLQRVLARYAEWLQQLPEGDRLKIKNARDAQERLRLIRQMREAEWIAHAPKRVQDELRNMPPERRSARVGELRKQQRQAHNDWHLAISSWDEIRQRPQLLTIAGLAPDVKAFVTETLMPLLSPEEKERLRKAQSQWPLFPQVLVDLADNHPIRLPGRTTGPKKFEDLSPIVQKHLSNLKAWPPPAIKKTEGKWPDYAIAVSQFAAKHAARNPKLLPGPLGESTLAEFSAAIQQFYKERLLPRLTTEDKEILARAEGKWPQFPQALVQLSTKRGLAIPGMTLPGPHEMWNRFRIMLTFNAEPLPEVPDETLLEFVRKGMTQEERATLYSYSLADPASREQARRLFYERNPTELERRRQADQKAIQKKKTPAKK